MLIVCIDNIVVLWFFTSILDRFPYSFPTAYIPNNFDQYIGQTILMPYESAAATEDLDAYDADCK